LREAPRASAPVLASIVNRSPSLIGELLLGKLGEPVVVCRDAPHNAPRDFVSHLVGNRAGFLSTKAPMLRIPYFLNAICGAMRWKLVLRKS
jgi:hypothetical protein